MGKTLKEQGIDGEYVCKHCQLIYIVYGDRLRCDVCNSKLRYIRENELKELEERWNQQEVEVIE